MVRHLSMRCRLGRGLPALVGLPGALTLVAVSLLGLLAVGCVVPTDTNAGQDQPAQTAAPPPLSSDSFRSSCQGASLSRAKAYDKAAPAHKVVYFETYKDHLLEFPKELPEDWQVPIEATPEQYANVDLVVCSVRTADTFVKKCDGYKDDAGKATDDIVNVHDATYKLAVHEATSGKELAATTVDAHQDGCPTKVTFDAGAHTLEYYAAPAPEKVVAIAKPFAQP
jgi:hypothetical protein